MNYCKNYCEEKGISTSELNEAQRTLYYIAENMKMDKSISEEGYRHFQMAIKALEQESTGHWIDTDNYYQRWKCSECGYHTRDAEPNYCPNCSARMFEPQEISEHNLKMWHDIYEEEKRRTEGSDKE